MRKLTLEESMALNPIPSPKYDSRSERISKLYLSLRDSLYYDINAGNFNVVDEKRNITEIILHNLKFMFFGCHRTKMAIQINGAVWLDLSDLEQKNIYKKLNK